MTRRLDRLLGEVKSFRTTHDCTALKIKEPPGNEPPGTVRRGLPPGKSGVVLTQPGIITTEFGDVTSQAVLEQSGHGACVNSPRCSRRAP
jgi:hypothetical protein